MTEEEYMVLQIEKQRIKQQDDEAKAINEMLSKTVDERFDKEFPVCQRCGKQKKHDNIPMCDECWKIVDKTITEENKSFVNGEYFAGMNQVNPNNEEDEFSNLMNNLDKFIP